MLNVNIICVGKLKEKYLRDACGEYTKRLGAFCKINIIEIDPSPLPDRPSEGHIENALAAESKKILSKIPSSSYTYAMCIEGIERSSEALSREIAALPVRGISSVNFIIGGSFGLSDTVKSAADNKLSMSPMTFPHQLARVMLLEQIYRAFQISSGGKYHK